MPDIVKTVKLHIHADAEADGAFRKLTIRYAQACAFISRYVFDHGFLLNSLKLQDLLYHSIREEFGLKSQFTISAIKTVTARYKTVKEQLYQKPYRYQDENGNWKLLTRTLDWLWTPITFKRPQADFVRNRDYSFVLEDGEARLSLNTLGKRIRVPYDVPKNFREYFDSSKWTFGGGKLVSMNGEWYFHVSVTKVSAEEFSKDSIHHVVGIDRGLRFLAVTYDEHGRSDFFDGDTIMRKRDAFQAVRSEVQSKGTKSAKRALKRISGRENRWMTDVNHRITKTLIGKYGSGTLFVLEDLAGVTFSEETLKNRSAAGRKQLCSWTFYQFEQMLTYKAHENASEVIKVRPDNTSQRCPKCGRIHKENRHHEIHEYICDCCGYRSNDDRIGAMNIQLLGTMYLSGDTNPRFGVRKEN